MLGATSMHTSASSPSGATASSSAATPSSEPGIKQAGPESGYRSRRVSQPVIRREVWSRRQEVVPRAQDSSAPPSLEFDLSNSTKPSSCFSQRQESPPSAARSASEPSQEQVRSAPTTKQPEEAGHWQEQVSSGVNAVFSLVRASWDGALPDRLSSTEWYPCDITPDQFTELHHQLEQQCLLAYFQDLRYDWNPDESSLILRLMPTALHEILQECICDEIKNELKRTSSGNDLLSSHVSEVRSYGHTDVLLKNRAKVVDGVKQNATITQRSPDASFSYENTTYPQFVMEIAYSQQRNDLQYLAAQYYQGSREEIKTVLTISVEYRSRKERQKAGCHSAQFCLYRGPKRVHKDVCKFQSKTFYWRLPRR